MQLRVRMPLTPPLRDNLVGEGVPGIGGELIESHYMQTDRALQIDVCPVIYITSRAKALSSVIPENHDGACRLP